MWSGLARAADPTTSDCLAAAEASLKSGNEHHLRTEREQLLVCAASSCPPDIVKECIRRVEEVNVAIPTIIFEAKDAAGNDLSAVKVTLDGEVLAEKLDGTALSIDPGEHTFLFETAGQPPITKHYVIHEAQKDRHEAIAFGTPPVPAIVTPPPAVTAPTSSTAAPAPALAAVAPSPVESNRALGTQKIVAIVAGSVGVVGVIGGTIFGLVAMSRKNDAQKVCSGQCPTQAGVNDWNDAKDAGNASTAFYIIGGLGLAGGAALWFTAPSSNHGPGPQVGVGPGGIQLKGTW
jgi:hypothetical protein